MWGKKGKEGEGESESTIKFILLEAFEAEGVKAGEGSWISDSLVAEGTFYQLGNYRGGCWGNQMNGIINDFGLQRNHTSDFSSFVNLKLCKKA